jgi:hypothetical protein
MKIIASGLLVLGLLAVQVSEANAVVCARGPMATAGQRWSVGPAATVLRWCAVRFSTNGGTPDLRGVRLAKEPSGRCAFFNSQSLSAAEPSIAHTAASA